LTRKIFISRELPDEALRLIHGDFTVEVHRGAAPLSREGLLAGVADASGLICQVTDAIDGDVLAAAPNLAVVANLAVGHNNIDVQAARRRGVVVTNTPDVLTETTADFAWALLMAAARRVVEADRYVRSGQWDRWRWELLWGLDVHGKTLGIIGFGRIGRAVARRALGFGMRVLYTDEARADAPAEQELRATYVRQETLLQESDFVTLHTPLLPGTRHLIDERTLRTMKPGAVLVNAARGPIVDEAALIDALAARRIAGAALDVFEQEPVASDNPLLAMDNVIVTPHSLCWTDECFHNMAVTGLASIVDALAGRTPEFVVDRSVLDHPRVRAPLGR